jgi:hypothetical protein
MNSIALSETVSNQSQKLIKKQRAELSPAKISALPTSKYRIAPTLKGKIMTTSNSEDNQPLIQTVDDARHFLRGYDIPEATNLIILILRLDEGAERTEEAQRAYMSMLEAIYLDSDSHKEAFRAYIQAIRDGRHPDAELRQVVMVARSGEDEYTYKFTLLRDAFRKALNASDEQFIKAALEAVGMLKGREPEAFEQYLQEKQQE